MDIVFGAGGYCPEVLIDGVNAGSNEWGGSGMEHLELVRSRPTRNGSETYYKTWTLIPKVPGNRRKESAAAAISFLSVYAANVIWRASGRPGPSAGS